MKPKENKNKKEKTEPIQYSVPQSAEITDELRRSYLDYAMSVIVGRALPDVRDGLKPVHRRILWAMWDSGLTAGAKMRKSANIVGEVLGRYHPHGDMAVYDALVRMAQDFSMRYPLIAGQGNFGSIDGDSAAAMRYSEAKLAKIAEEMLFDIEKETIDWLPNYDGRFFEPKVLPAKLPQLLLNGSVGIAVGMATSIPPHNLAEIIDASIYLIKNPKAASEDLMGFIKGPDFPTGGIIYDKKAITEAYSTGRGSIIVRGSAEIVDRQIIITEIPYQVNKSELIIRIADLVENKKIEGIRDVRDESDRDGLRIVIDLKSDAVSQKILNQLYNLTDLQKKFHLNMLALVDGIKPETLSVKDVLSAHIEHRQKVVRRRAEFDLKKAKERAHILEGLSRALEVIDKIIAMIKKSAHREEALSNLIKNFKMTEIQAGAILEMKLQTLAALERERIEDELKEKKKKIKELEILLKDKKAILNVVEIELAELKTKYDVNRRTKVFSGGLQEFSDEDLIPEEEVMITFSHRGYIKRLPPQSIKSQQRGGRGVLGSDIGEDDFLTHFISANTHDNLLFFTAKGRVFQTKAYEIPSASRTAKGRAIQNFLEIPADETISAIVAYSNNKTKSQGYLVMVTEKGVIKKTEINEFSNVRRNGIIAIGLTNDDKLVGAELSSGKDEIIITTEAGQAIRFKEEDVRSMGRTAAGVRGINLDKNDRVASFSVIIQGAGQNNLMSVMANGLAKQTPLKQYKIQRRAGCGIKTALITKKTGRLVTSKIITPELEDLIMISSQGQILRTKIKSVRTTARSAQGVRVIKLGSGDTLIGAVCL